MAKMEKGIAMKAAQKVPRNEGCTAIKATLKKFPEKNPRALIP